MSLRDELANDLNRQGIADGNLDWWSDIVGGIMPIIERALAAERASTLEEVRTAVSDLMARTVGQAYKIYYPGLKDALSILKTLPRDRSALYEMLAQARREQREEDAQIAEDDDNAHRSIHVAAAIRAPAAPGRAEMKCGHPHACLKTRPFVPSDYPYEPPLSKTEEFCTACERLAAERAATIEECKRIAALHRDIDVEAEIDKLPRDRSALDFAKKMAAAEARHEMNQKIGEHLGQDANEKSTLQMLDDALAQARREQED